MKRQGAQNTKNQNSHFLRCIRARLAEKTADDYLRLRAASRKVLGGEAGEVRQATGNKENLGMAAPFFLPPLVV